MAYKMTTDNTHRQKEPPHNYSRRLERWEGMEPLLLPPLLHHMFFYLRDIMTHVVNQVHV